jgi:DNA-binding NarL/FixJ family response regulator
MRGAEHPPREDDGAGFEPSAASRGTCRGFGMTSMRARAEAAGGQLHVASSPGRGTVVEEAAEIPLRVVIADDHPLVREGVRRALTDGGVVVAGEAVDAPGAVLAALRDRPDLCLLDIEMPGSGLVAAREISQRLPDTAIVMLTVSDEAVDLLAAIRAGAVGYLLKDGDPDRLASTLRAVVSGDTALPRRLMAQVLEHVRTDDRRRRGLLRMPRGVQLSEREWEVLELMHDDLTTSDVAMRLSVSAVTVRRHLSTAVAKLGVSDRRAALELVRELNLGTRGADAYLGGGPRV